MTWDRGWLGLGGLGEDRADPGPGGDRVEGGSVGNWLGVGVRQEGHRWPSC